MKPSKGILNQDRIILTLLIFVLATTSLWVRFIVVLPSGGFYKLLEKILFYFGFLGYGVTISVIIIHYLSIVIKWFKKDNNRVILSVAIFLGILYSLFDGLKEQSWLVFLRDLPMAGLLILGLSAVQKIFSKNAKKKSQ